MRDEICYAPAVELAAKIRSKDLSPTEVMEAHLDKIESVNPRLNAIVTFAKDPMKQAREAEAAVNRGDKIGPLHGVPYTLKDCVETEGLRTTLGSKLMQHNVSVADAEIYRRLKSAGGILLGKTNMPEFALWWKTDNDLFGLTRNPYNLDRTVGGSSGGEAAAIAAGLSPLGVGTDLGGSIRQPASFCGIYGFKPTLGRVPYSGILPQTILRAMHVGPMARTLEDTALGMSIMAGTDQTDIFSPPVPVPNYMNSDCLTTNLKVGWSPTMGIAVDSEVQGWVAKAAEAMLEAGMAVEQVEIPALSGHDAGDISTVIFLMEARQHLEPIIKGKESDLTVQIDSRYVKGPSFGIKEYMKANLEWESLRIDVADYFTRYDIFLCPTVFAPPFPHDESQFRVDGQVLPSRHALRATLPWDLTGSPALSVPFGWSTDGLPIGVQIVGRHFGEDAVLAAAKVLDDRRDIRRPQIAQ